MTIAERMKQLKMTRAQLHHRCYEVDYRKPKKGLSQVTIMQIVNGTRSNPGWEVSELMAAALGWTAQEFRDAVLAGQKQKN